jgi:hypothetical protein
MRAVGSLAWIGLAVFLVAVLSGAAVAAVRGLAAWRAFRAFERKLEAAVAATTRLIDAIEPRVARASATAARLQEAQARLQESTATAGVLFSAFGEALALLRRVSAFVPR